MKGPRGPQTRVREGAYAIKVSMKFSNAGGLLYIALELSAQTTHVMLCQLSTPKKDIAVKRTPRLRQSAGTIG
jgi:hypothetical protein